MTDPIRLLRWFALALVVWREARGESPLGKLLVAQTVENRVRDPRWPDTYIGVIMQPWQFSAFTRHDPNALLFPTELDRAWPECVAVADCVLSTPTPFTTANHYHAITVTPSWASAGQVVASEGRHRFYRL